MAELQCQRCRARERGSQHRHGTRKGHGGRPRPGAASSSGTSALPNLPSARSRRKARASSKIAEGREREGEHDRRDSREEVAPPVHPPVGRAAARPGAVVEFAGNEEDRGSPSSAPSRRGCRRGRRARHPSSAPGRSPPASGDRRRPAPGARWRAPGRCRCCSSRPGREAVPGAPRPRNRSARGAGVVAAASTASTGEAGISMHGCLPSTAK